MTTRLFAYNTAQSHYEPIVCDTEGRLVVNINGANFTESGELLVNGGTGGSGGDASSINQLNSNLAVCTRLDASNVVLTNILSKSGEISLKMDELQLQKAKYTIEAVASLAPDTTPQFTIPPSGIEKSEGWYFKNLQANQPSQIYYYAYTNPSLQVPARQYPYQLGDIATGYCVVKMLSINATAGLVMLGLYSRPTGSGDAQPGFFKSRKVYSIPTGSKLTQGMSVLLYWGVEPSKKLHAEVSRIELSLATITGSALNTEILAYLTVNTDSGALAGNSEYIISHAGFITTDGLIMDSEFTGDSSTSSVSDATSANQTTQINIATQSNLALSNRLDTLSTNITNSNVALCGRLDKNTYTNSNLHIRDDIVLYQLVNSNTVLTNSNLALSSRLNSLISDGIMVKGYNFTTGIQEEIQSINNSLAVVIQNQSNYATSEKQDDTYQKLTDIEIEIDSINSKVATELTLSGIKTQTDKLIFNGNSLYTEITNLPTVEINNFPEYALDSTLLLVKSQTDRLTFAGTALEVEVQNAVGITSATPLDVHVYGTQNGTTWNPIHSDSNGNLTTHAMLQDGNGDDITSTLNGTIRSIDVHLQNTATSPANCLSYGKDADTNLAVPLKVDEDGVQIVSIQSSVQVLNATGSELAVKPKQFGSYANLCNNQTFTPGQASTALNISEFCTMAGYYTDTYGGGAPTGSLRLQYSFDGTTWYNIYNTQVFPSGTGTRTATIFNQAVFGLNFVRFLNDTNQTHPSVTITILGSTLQ